MKGLSWLRRRSSAVASTAWNGGEVTSPIMEVHMKPALVAERAELRGILRVPSGRCRTRDARCATAAAAALFVLALAGCQPDQASKPPQQAQKAAPGTSNCCQCSGKTNPNPPPAYTLDPDCNPTGWSTTTCDSTCTSAGHSSGAIFQGTCQAAPKGGAGNLCQ